MNGPGTQAGVSEGWILRSELATRIGAALTRGSVMVVARAGYGKTTAIAQGLRVAGLASAWISCTPAEQAPGTLFVRILRSIQHQMPGAVDALAQQLLSAPERVDATEAVQQLITELEQLLLEPIVVVLDDAEQLESATAALSLVNTIIGAGSRQLHLAVASRRSLELRLARSRAAGTISDFGQADLVFSAAECAEILRLKRGEEPEADEVDATMTATEGWPLGVALTAAGKPKSRTEMPQDAFVQSYFEEEVLEHLDDGRRALIIDSAVPQRLTPGVISALELPRDFLEQSERDGLFLRKVVETGAYVYHPLFREFLLEHLSAERSPEQRRDLSARVAQAVFDEGNRLEAIEHWTEAECWDQVLTTLEQEGPTLARTTPELLADWLSRLPPEARRRPTIRVLDGQLAWGDGDYDRAVDALSQAVDGFASEGSAVAEWLARFTLVDGLVSVGDLERAKRVAGALDEPSAQDAGVLAPATALWVANALALSGQADESQRLSQRALRHPDSGLIPHAEGIRIAFLAWPAGRIDEALDRLHQAGAAAKLADPMRAWPYVVGLRAILHMQLGQWDAALQIWAENVKVAAGGLAPMLADSSRAWRVLVLVHLGKLREAEAEMAQFRGLERGWRAHQGHVPRAVLASHRGDAGTTREWTDRAMRVASDGALQFRLWAVVELAPALARIGEVAGARTLLGQGRDWLDIGYPGSSGSMYRAHLWALEAWLAHEGGDPKACQVALSHFWAMAGENRQHILRREWPHLQDVVWAALELGQLPAIEVMDALSLAFPDGIEAVRFLEHPDAATRRAAIQPAVASGDPRALSGLGDLAADPDHSVAEEARRRGQRLDVLAPPLTIRLLGRFAVSRGAWVAGESDWERPTAARLVRFLAIRNGERVPEEEICEALWPRLEPAGARRSIHVAASRARRALDLPGTEHSLIESAHGCYRLCLGDRDRIDSEDFAAAAAEALQLTSEELLPTLLHARSLWAGEPLPEERYEDWATAWRERLADLYVAVLAQLIEVFAGKAKPHRVIELASELIEVDPVNEAAHRALMAAYTRMGRRGQALRQYLACRRVLIDELGVEPSAETSRLQAQVLAGAAI